MFRTKTIIRVRLRDKLDFPLKPYWKISMGKYLRVTSVGISRLFRLVSTLISHKDKVYSIDIIIKRKRNG